MAQLSAAERKALPDRAFAYVDSNGRRRLPIYDAAHVRNALARFNQVDFESTTTRERARRRLLTAAKRFRIVPIGFIDSEIRRERRSATTSSADAELPSGFVTLLMSDIEGSTQLVAELGDEWGDALDLLRDLQCGEVERHGGHVVEVRADELFASFASPRGAVEGRDGHPSSRSGHRLAWWIYRVCPNRCPCRVPDAARRQLHRHGGPYGGARQ